MSDKFEPGDLAIITKTTTGKNVGVIVQLIEFLGPFENLGDTWFVHTRDPITTGCTESGNLNDFVRFRHPSTWMKKILPPPLDTKAEERRLVEKVLERAAKLGW